MKILAINFGGIGDEILFLPTLESIRQAYPEARLSLLLEPRSKSFQQVTNLVDEILEFDIKKKPLQPKDLWDVLQLIRRGNFDLVLSSGSSPPVAALLFLAGIKTRIGYGSNALAKILLTNPVPLDREQYAACMYQDLASGIGVSKMSVADCEPRAVLKPDSVSRMTEFLQRVSLDGGNHTSGSTTGDTTNIDTNTNTSKSDTTDAQNKVESTTGNTGSGGARAQTEKGNRRHRVLIHPGTSRLAVEKGIIKTWSNENWLELISKLQAESGIQTIVAGGPDDEAIIKELLAQMKPSENLVSAVGQTKSLADLAALIEQVDLMVCVDSAPMHLAVALGKPVVALFGPTDESKLLPADAKFKALRDRPTSEFPRQLKDGLGELLQPYIVFQSVMDQLKG